MDKQTKAGVGRLTRLLGPDKAPWDIRIDAIKDGKHPKYIIFVRRVKKGKRIIEECVGAQGSAYDIMNHPEKAKVVYVD